MLRGFGHFRYPKWTSGHVYPFSGYDSSVQVNDSPVRISDSTVQIDDSPVQAKQWAWVEWWQQQEGWGCKLASELQRLAAILSSSPTHRSASNTTRKNIHRGTWKNVLLYFCSYVRQLLADYQNSFNGTLQRIWNAVVIIYPTWP